MEATTQKSEPKINPGQTIGKFVDTDGIEKELVYREYALVFPGATRLRMIVAKPTAAARASEEYVELRRKHGDDWEEDFTACWDTERIPTRLRNIIRNRILPIMNAPDN